MTLPAWLGLATLSIAGLFVFMFLPARYLNQENQVFRRKIRRLIYCAMAPIILLAVIFADPFGGFFAWEAFCRDCTARQSSRNIFWIPFHHVEETKLSGCLNSLGYKPGHKHEWLFSTGGGGSIQCAIGEGRHLIEIANSPDVVMFLEKARKHLPDEEFAAAVRQILSEPKTLKTGLLIACGTSMQDFPTALDAWKSEVALEEEMNQADKNSPDDNALPGEDSHWQPQNLDHPTDAWPVVNLK